MKWRCPIEYDEPVKRPLRDLPDSHRLMVELRIKREMLLPKGFEPATNWQPIDVDVDLKPIGEFCDVVAKRSPPFWTARPHRVQERNEATSRRRERSVHLAAVVYDRGRLWRSGTRMILSTRDGLTVALRNKYCRYERRLFDTATAWRRCGRLGCSS